MTPLASGKTQLEVGRFDANTENLSLGERSMIFSG